MTEQRIWPPVQGYDLVAADYDEWYWRPFWEKNEAPLVSQLFDTVPSPRLSLDLGCGTGMYCRILEPRCRVIGLDPSRRMLGVSQRRSSVHGEFVCARAAALPLPARCLDFIIAARSLCHEPDISAAIAESARVMRPGGLFVISDIHARHDYPHTRIPASAGDILIETIKRTPADCKAVAEQSDHWALDFELEADWNSLLWTPPAGEFARIDRTGTRPVFFVLALRRL